MRTSIALQIYRFTLAAQFRATSSSILTSCLIVTLSRSSVLGYRHTWVSSGRAL